MGESDSVTTKFRIDNPELFHKSINPRGLKRYAIGKACVEAIGSIESRIRERDGIIDKSFRLDVNTEESAIRKNIKDGFLTQQNFQSILCLFFHEFKRTYKYFQSYSREDIIGFLSSLELEHNEPGSVEVFRDFFGKLYIPENFRGFEIRVNEKWEFDYPEPNAEEKLEENRGIKLERIKTLETHPKKKKVWLTRQFWMWFLIISFFLLVIVVVIQHLQNRAFEESMKFGLMKDPTGQNIGTTYFTMAGRNTYFDTITFDPNEREVRFYLKMEYRNQGDSTIQKVLARVNYPKEGTEKEIRINGILEAKYQQVVRDFAYIENLPKKWSLRMEEASLINTNGFCGPNTPFSVFKDTRLLEKKDGVHIGGLFPRNTEFNGDLRSCSDGYILMLFKLKNEASFDKVGFDPDPLKTNLGFLTINDKRYCNKGCAGDKDIVKVPKLKPGEIYNFTTYATYRNHGDFNIENATLKLYLGESEVNDVVTFTAELSGDNVPTIYDTTRLIGIPNNSKLSFESAYVENRYGQTDSDICPGYSYKIGGYNESDVLDGISLEVLDNVHDGWCDHGYLFCKFLLTYYGED